MFRLSSLLALTIAALPLPVMAAERGPIDTRLERVEKELRAVQRKVFPGGDQSFSQAEISAPEVVAPTGVPASAPLNDLTARVDSLEQSIAQLTAQVEQADHRLTILSEQAAKDRQEFANRLQVLEQSSAAAEPAVGAELAAPLVTPVPAAPRPGPGKQARPAPAAPVVAPADEPAADEAALVASDDPAEEAYMAGYRLWTQKKYPEAQAALQAVVKKYPKGRRASYAQNLLGRAYLDAGRPANAAEAFAANYQTNPRGERAPDSLYYLGQSLVKLNKAADACRVYDEFTAAYGTTAEAGLKTRVATARKDAKCK
ncbi:tetratricopeptide repeat protein [uncultured Sphingomonas sp.]|mgnify:CR=1 FL=1|uniref:tetratricopeptide repeat protein n=1 Tax=uncultured Sphingomonas sp. TaxID=158754 RepID=UPI0025E3BC64|nr:tetratricopeptide repeat protein [uncultured Sphingomonas sp.]